MATINGSVLIAFCTFCVCLGAVFGALALLTNDSYTMPLWCRRVLIAVIAAASVAIIVTFCYLPPKVTVGLGQLFSSITFLILTWRPGRKPLRHRDASGS